MADGADHRNPGLRRSQRNAKAELEAAMGGRKPDIILLGAISAIGLVTLSILTFRMEIPPANPPAVMTGAPSPLAGIYRLEPITTTGERLFQGHSPDAMISDDDS